ncbi:MAG: hypothetical protein COW30_09130 [Rhodospirillales bacterium CG15_BIG_FIL_POST_REV_8_21_14_020_66_15]|nr:MAG: hypothetical protein COW30_09130 [Rhodospirillales bacterium CG15_BIG_FIL_POST_REV_8_21_14_020_66_15]
MMGHIMAGPPWVTVWVMWMGLINLLCLAFIRHVEARWVLASMAGAWIMIEYLFQTYGYTRILGLAHVVFWTPVVIYLWRRRRGFDTSTVYGKWLWAVMATDLTSLAIDYVDVVRFFMGDGALS